MVSSETDSHQIGLVHPGVDGHDPPEQLLAVEALDKRWTTFFDHLPDSTTPFLHAVDGRAPLRFDCLKMFIVSDAVDIPGLARDDRLCTAIPTGPEAAVCFFAFALRCAFAPSSLGLSREEFEFEFLDLPAKALVVFTRESLEQEEYAQSCDAVSVARKTNVEKILELTPSPVVAGLFKLSKHAASRPVRGELLGNPLLSVRREDIALVLHTSGTTKKPKIVPLTHANITCGALCISSTILPKPEDVCVNAMPLFHIHGLIVNILMPAVSQSQVVCLPGVFNVRTFHAALGTDPQPTWYSAVPTMHLQILQVAQQMALATGKPPEHKLVLARNCSAALVPSVAEDMEATLRVSVMPTYAMTESMPIASNPRYGVRKLRSVGPKAGPSLRIMSPHPDNSVLPVGVEGEVAVREGPVTSGYEIRNHMDADPNVESFGDGWLRTGDKGWLDSDGYLYLSGRFKEIINRAGEKISPFEVENALRTHPAINDMIAFAVPHTTLGEVVGVAVKLNDCRKLTIRELRAYAIKEGRLQSKWIPEILVRLPTIPKGPTGKPVRINLSSKLGIEPVDGKFLDLELLGLCH
eukprot:TRINITY_DN40373_c0_g1_i1.p1 TRINITY_DN40373_c0_g1~~TRINITY_DN40373_c0_g1_i1.p1  ORF type:complete len:596 (+),score=78.14 TRINITY_DN40373_c0_g1_i1:49-1788(+)